VSDARIRVLIAEDEPQLGGLLETFLASRGFSPVLVRDGRRALERLLAEPFDVAILDIVMPELDGLAVLRQLREEPLPPEVIVSSGIGTVDTAIAAIKLGAYDYLPKPYRMTEIEALVRRAHEKRQLVRVDALRRRRRAMNPGVGELRTSSPELQAILATVEPVAAQAGPVCLVGERGTGKVLVARALHRMSGRPGPLVELRCADLPAARHEAELVGRDAAEPADRRAGAVELAAGGTLFVADVERLDARAQARLLTLLEEGSFARVDGQRVRRSDARVVVATSMALPDAVAARLVRPDLAQHLLARVIPLPPLRQRKGDIRLLAEKFLAEMGGALPPRLTDAAAEALERYPWPGNVEELRVVLARAVLLSGGAPIQPRDLALGEAPGPRPAPHAVPASLEEVERRHISEVLAHVGWHQGRAAQLLGISAKTLYRKIREFGLERPRAGALTR
jgi:two-component system NtrC family response regulator